MPRARVDRRRLLRRVAAELGEWLVVVGVAIVMFALLTFAAGSARGAVPATLPAPPDGPILQIQCAPLTGGVHMCRSQYGDEICYAVVAEMGGMAKGEQAAVSCFQKES